MVQFQTMDPFGKQKTILTLNCNQTCLSYLTSSFYYNICCTSTLVCPHYQCHSSLFASLCLFNNKVMLPLYVHYLGIEVFADGAEDVLINASQYLLRWCVQGHMTITQD